jgi:hypothetical protein
VSRQRLVIEYDDRTLTDEQADLIEELRASIDFELVDITERYKAPQRLMNKPGRGKSA